MGMKGSHDEPAELEGYQEWLRAMGSHCPLCPRQWYRGDRARVGWAVLAQAIPGVFTELASPPYGSPGSAAAPAPPAAQRP